MRKTVRAVLPCPYCGQKIRFNEDNPAYLMKTNPKVWKKRFEKKREVRSVIICPHKNCQKAFAVVVTPRKIRLSKRISKIGRILIDMLG